MTQGFQHQDPWIGFTLLKSAAVPQHGQRPDKAKAQPVRPERTVPAKPGH